MRRAAIAATLVLAGCGAQEFDTLLYEVDTDRRTFFCSNGEQVDLPFASAIEASVGGQALACEGIVFGRCPSDSTSGGVEAGATQCLSPQFNPLLGTCVDEFFGCFEPMGACNQFGSDISWDSGHRVDRDYTGIDDEHAFFAPGADEACALMQRVTEFDLLPGVGEEYQFLKPR